MRTISKSLISRESNKKPNFTRIGILLLFSMIMLSSLTINPASAATINYTVALDGTGNFRDIQSAINAVPSTSTAVITVKAGTYMLNDGQQIIPIKIKSGITIRGSGIDKTIIKCYPTKLPAGSTIRMPAFLATTSLKNFILESMTIIQNGTPDNKGYNTIDIRGSSNSNIRLTDLKIMDSFGAGISIKNFNGLTIDNCQTYRSFTGIVMSGGQNAIVKNSDVYDTKGDGIFTQVNGSLVVKNVIIQGNTIKNSGDTGVDITTQSDVGYHYNITVQSNTFINSHIRVSGAKRVRILDNVMSGDKSFINVDGGQLRPVDIVIHGNTVTTPRYNGIRIAGAQDVTVSDNKITMLTASTRPQVGISIAAYGNVMVSGNTIKDPADYGIDFCGWWISDHIMTIKDNVIINPGKIGIYDNDKGQGPVVVDNNEIWDQDSPFSSIYGIRTGYASNVWTIKNNNVYAGHTAAISAPKSKLSGNTYLKPI
jgi:hypothetical protein